MPRSSGTTRFVMGICLSEAIRPSCGFLQKCVNECSTTITIFQMPDAPAKETLRTIQKFYTWPTLTEDVQKHVRSCMICATVKRSARQTNAPMRAYVPKKSWQTISIDFLGPYEETSSGSRFVLVVTDTFSRWVEAFPLARATAKATIEKLENEVFCRWGYPNSIIADNGTQF